MNNHCMFRYRLSFLVAIFILSGFFAKTQATIAVSGSNGCDGSAYTTLTGAGGVFASLNGLTQAGKTITVTINSDCTETGANTLTGAAGMWSSLTITTSGAYTLSGTYSGALISLSGADNVTIDGRIGATGSTPSLTITNTFTGTTASTIRFIGDAVSNTVKYCTIKGASANTSGGVIFFATGSSGGNDNNTISYNNITNAGTRPVNMIYSAGTAYNDNSGNTISNNNIYDFLSLTLNSYGINLATYTTGWTISDNSFYQTTAFSPTAAVAYTVINIAIGSGYVIDANYIGGTAAKAGGTALTKNVAFNNTFYGIANSSPDISSRNTITNNKIKNIVWTSTITSAVSNFYGIYSTAVVDDINYNAIGNTKTTSNITYTNAASAGTFYGLYASAGCKLVGDTISGITVNNSNATYSTNFIGIYMPTAAAVNYIHDCVVGSTTTAQSIQSLGNSTGRVKILYGIQVDANTAGGYCDLAYNTVQNLYMISVGASSTMTGSLRGIYLDASSVAASGGGNQIIHSTIQQLNGSISYGNVCGIYASGSSIASTNGSSYADNTINTITIASSNATASANGLYVSANGGTHTPFRNTIQNIVNSGTGSAYGMYFSSGTTGQVVSNYVNLPTGSGTGSYYGIYNNGMAVAGTLTDFHDNIIVMGISGTPAQNTVYGIYDNYFAGNNVSYRSNTVLIGGTLSTGTVKSYCLYSNYPSSVSTRLYKSNLLVNTRSTASGSNYAMYLNNTSTTSLTVDYNDYYVTGTGGVLAYYAGDRTTLGTIQAATSQDAHSVSIDPSFTNTSGNYSADNDLITSAMGLIGDPAYIGTADYASTTRTISNMGAYESGIGNKVDLYSGTTYNSGYTTLKAAVDAITAGTCTGDITIKLNASTTEPACMKIYYSGYNYSSYTSIHIYPTVAGVSLTCIDATTAMITLRGADNVTIDGRVNGTGNTIGLTINQTQMVSDIMFEQDACNNTVKYCDIVSIANAAIYFSTATTTGNDGNTIDHCNIHSGLSKPYLGVFSGGTTTAASYFNSENFITNNNIYDMHNPTGQDAGIYLLSGNTDWTITGNSFYQTGTQTATSASSDLGIYIGGGNGNNFTVSGNYIGGSAPQCGGTAWTVSNNTLANSFTGIQVNAGTTTASNITGNTIANMSFNMGDATWSGISASGKVNVGASGAGNTIGGTTGSTSLQISRPAASTSASSGILVTSGNTVSVAYNTIGSITLGTTDAVGQFSAIRNTGAITSLTIDHNIIGSATVANSITTATTVPLIGILNSGATTACSITTNTVANLSNTSTSAITSNLIKGIAVSAGKNQVTGNQVFNLNTTAGATGTGGSSSVLGIAVSSTAAGNTVQQNTIYGLNNTHATAATAVAGIHFAGPTSGTNLVARNQVYGLSTSSSSASSELRGINFAGGLATVQNNIVYLGYNASGSAITSGISMTGLYDDGCLAGTGMYFNSVYIGGTGVGTGTGNTYAFSSATTTNTRAFENNLFFNARSNATTGGKHYAIGVAGTAANPAGLTLNNNNYYTTGAGGVFGYFNSADVANLSAWKTAVGLDAYSSKANPVLTSATPMVAADFIPTKSLTGATIGSVTTDYAGTARVLPTVGAYEIAAATGGNVDLYLNGALKDYYSTLKAAFDDINAGTYTGAITLKVNGATTETATASLDASGSGSASYTSITIYPTVSGLSITGNIAAPLINLNGADNVTLDGRVNQTGTANLVVSNTNTGGTTIRLIGDACSNTVKYCDIQGVSSSASMGTIFFSAGTTTGNDGNTIDNCKIHDGATTPYFGIFSLGTTTGETYFNSGNTISNNEIYNFFYPGGVDAGISVGAGNTGWIISGNSLYQTAIRVSTGASSDCGIQINNSGNNFTVSGNYIGGGAPNCGGSAWTENGTAVANGFTAIKANVGTTTASTITGNTIANIVWNAANASWNGISVSGLVNVGASGAGNIIGGTTGSSSIQIVPASGAVAPSHGIVVTSGSTVSVAYNTIGSITIGSATANSRFYPIRSYGSVTSLTIDHNTIGSTSVANSITSSSLSTLFGIANDGATTSCSITNNTIANLSNTSASAPPGNLIKGIVVSGGTNLISNNQIFNLSTTASGTGTGGNALLIGISVSSATTNNTVQQNTIYGLSNTHATAATTVIGIHYAGPTTGANLVARNLVYGLSTSSSSASSQLLGINFASGLASVQNNMVCLGYDASGAAITSGIAMNGIYDGGCTAGSGVYFNSVYIGGTGVNTTAGNTYAFSSATTTNTRIFENNVFVNARSNASTGGKHYAVKVAGTLANPEGLTMDYNNYKVFGTGGVLGYFNSDDVASLAAWRTAVGQDAKSYSDDPHFIAPTASTPDLHINAGTPIFVEGMGIAISGIDTDYDGQTRSGLTPTDLGADAGDFVPIAPVITYTLPQVYTYGTTISTLTPTNTGGAVASYSVSPALPAGLTLSSTTGDISGTPTTAKAIANYVITATNTGGSGTFTLSLEVSPKPLTMTGLSVPVSKVYDGTTTATVTNAAALLATETIGTGTAIDGKPFEGDAVSITGTATGTYNSATVASATTVTYSGLSLTGAKASNYTFTIQSPASATITAKALTISGISISNKTYDGLTTATIAGTAAYAGLQNGETFTVSGTPTASFTTAAVGTAKAVTVTGYTAPSGNYTITQPSGLTADITAKALTISGISISNKTYDGLTTATIAGTAAYAGLQNGETFAVSGTPTASFTTAAVGTAKAVTVTGYTAPGSNYTITQPSGLTADITAKALTISGISISNKTYDGLTTATIAGTAAYAGLQNGETFTVSGTPTASFTTAAVGTAKAVTVTGYTAPSGNYTITQPSGLTADITAKALTISGISISNKTYDGLTTATIAGTAAYAGLQNGETFAVSGTPTASFTTAAVGTAKAVTVTGYTAPGSNYTITQPSGLTADITAKALTISGISISNKTYDGLTTATIAGTAAYAGLQNGETFTVSGTPTASFTTAAVGTAKAVTVTGYTAPSGNYTITQPSGLTADITAKALTISGISISNKTYDGLTTATIAGTAAYVGLQNGETFAVSGTPTASFTTAAVGTAKAVTVTGYTAPGSNYTITQPSGLTANITAKALTISGISISNKTYDGLTTATIAGTAAYAGLQNGETFAVSGTPTASFTTAAVGTAKAVTVTGYTAPGSNYTITQPSGLTADITAKALTISGISISNKTYDGLTTATIAGTAAYAGLQNGETFAVSGTPTASFTTAAVGTAKAVTVTGYTAPGSNYTITQPSGLTADITAKALTISGISISNKTYDGLATATIAGTAAYAGLQNGETFTVSGTPTASFTTAAVGTAKAVTVTGYTAPSGNYTITQPSGLTADITAKALTISGISISNKTYDGLTTATIAGTAAYAGLQNGETFAVSGTPTASFTTAAVGTAKAVTVTGYTAPGSNYTITQPSGLTADITAKALTISGISISNKTYDGLTTATIAGTAAYAGLQNGETFAVSGTPTASFTTAAVGTAKAVTVTGYTAPGSNYTITQPSGLTADITAKALTVTAVSQSVPYTTSVAEVIGAGTYTLSGLVTGDGASVVTGSASYTTNYTATTPEGAAGITITPVTTGLLATNYSFTTAPGTITVIAPLPRKLTLKVYLEGLWNGTAMNKVKNWVSESMVDAYASSIADVLTVELHDATTYSTVAYSVTGLELSQNGSVSSPGLAYIDLPVGAVGSYFITIKHRNHLETTSANAVSFLTDVTYDFTDASSKAYIDPAATFTPMKNLNGKWVIYAGNVNSSGTNPVINSTDYLQVFNNYSHNTGVYGYRVNDLNGDGIVDFLDFMLNYHNRDVYFLK